MKRFISAALAVCVLAWSGAASAAVVYDEWSYSYGPRTHWDHANWPATGTPIDITISSRPAILSAVFWFRLEDLTIDALRITNATPGNLVRLGHHNPIVGNDYLGIIDADGTFEWAGALTPPMGTHNYSFFRIIVGPLIDGRMDYTSRFDIDQLTFSGTIPSIVPEPATWAMMIIGFGAVGSMVRGSRRRTALIDFVN